MLQLPKIWRGWVSWKILLLVFLWNTLLCGRLNEIVHDAWVCRLGDHQVYRDQHTRVYIGSQFTRQHSTRLLQYLWFDIWTGHSVHIFLVWENLLKMLFLKLRFNLSKWQGTQRSWQNYFTFQNTLLHRGKKGLVMGVVVAKAKRTVFGGQEGK